MSKLQVNRGDETFTLDEFFKSLMFQRIMDGDFSRNERDTLLVIFRKTLHFDKWDDSIAVYWLAKAVGVGEATQRRTLKQLEAKGLLEIQWSKGGRTGGINKYHRLSLSNEFWGMVFRQWLDIKEEAGFYV